MVDQQAQKKRLRPTLSREPAQSSVGRRSGAPFTVTGTPPAPAEAPATATAGVITCDPAERDHSIRAAVVAALATAPPSFSSSMKATALSSVASSSLSLSLPCDTTRMMPVLGVRIMMAGEEEWARRRCTAIIVVIIIKPRKRRNGSKVLSLESVLLS